MKGASFVYRLSIDLLVFKNAHRADRLAMAFGAGVPEKLGKIHDHWLRFHRDSPFFPL
jgi:hypothetical protein